MALLILTEQVIIIIAGVKKSEIDEIVKHALSETLFESKENPESMASWHFLQTEVKIETEKI